MDIIRPAVLAYKSDCTAYVKFAGGPMWASAPTGDPVGHGFPDVPLVNVGEGYQPSRGRGTAPPLQMKKGRVKTLPYGWGVT